ncbi:ExbD/TolR family protein [Brevundimonas sp. 2R-24]|uniref:ExbD/TolR family protein n=1 Tax=Peiella sedimenti TaxID=3061083 RepID=A0ABT8SM01_9CAUL|nr:ExbD/TolR family protein [Caulobacteraceae bacterium XZ-24]
MALTAGSGRGGAGRGRRRGRRAALSEINVTPLVDVMLVLLIIFMVAAPLLTVGVPVELPKTDAGAVADAEEPLTVSIRRDGSIFVQEDPATLDQLTPRLLAMSGGEAGERPVFVRADGQASYETVAQVMARLSTQGFTKLNLITDTAPQSQAAPAPAPAEAAAPAEG